VKYYVDRVRVERQMSIRELAKQSHVAKSFIQKIEAGEANPSLEVMCRLAKALKVPVTDLFQYDG